MSLQISLRGLKNLLSTSIAGSTFRHSLGQSSTAAPFQLPKRFFGNPAASLQQKYDYDFYKVLIVTGNIRGAGTRSAAFLKLLGTEGETEPVIVGNTDDTTFDRASVRVFDVPVPRHIGYVKAIQLEKVRHTQSDTDHGWFLDRVEVYAPNGEKVLFPCHSWFGASDCGSQLGPLARNLVAVSETAATSEVRGEPVTVRASAIAIPHPVKVKKNVKGVNKRNFGWAGEDAYFYCHGRNDIFGMGVADGVFMWKEKGIDSGIFSRQLMETSLDKLNLGLADALQILHDADLSTKQESILGSATACVLTINQPHGIVSSANLGDSGFVLLGRAPGSETLDIKYRTNQLEHEFGRPFQLGHHEHADSPSKAETATLAVSKGDIIVMGTDGLFDNMDDGEIRDEILASSVNGPLTPQTLVQRLTHVAYSNSRNKGKSTPYARAASEYFDMVYNGGKPDDITVMVALLD